MNHHDHATLNEKIRGSYEHISGGLDAGNGISKEGWVRSLDTLRIRLPYQGMVDSMFERLDINGDGLISFSEFQRFSEYYPTMLDSIYYRCKDYFTDIQQKKQVEEAIIVRDELIERERSVTKTLEEVLFQRSEQERTIRDMEHAFEAAKLHEQEAIDNVSLAEVSVIRSAQHIDEAGHELQRSAEGEQHRIALHIESQQRVEQFKETLIAHDGEVALADEHVRQLERLLIEAKRELEARILSREATHSELLSSQGREHNAHGDVVEAQLGVRTANEKLSHSHDEAARMKELENDAAAKRAAAAGEVGKVCALIENERRDLLIVIDEEEQRRIVAENALNAIRTQEQAIHTLEQRNVDFNVHRKAVEQQETPLLHQEATLREQRATLENREARLRNEVSTFTNSNGRTPAERLVVLSPSAGRVDRLDEYSHGIVAKQLDYRYQ